MNSANKFVVVPYERYQILINQKQDPAADQLPDTEESNKNVPDDKEKDILPEPKESKVVAVPISGQGIKSVESSEPSPSPPPGIPAKVTKKRKVPIKRPKHIWVENWKSW